MIFAQITQSSFLKISETYLKKFRITLSVSVFFLLFACSNQSVQIATEPSETETTPQASASFLELASNSSGYQAQRYLLLAFKQAILEADSTTAETLIGQINIEGLTPEDYASFQLSYSDFLISTGQYTKALDTISSDQPNPSNLMGEWNYRMGAIQSGLGNYQIATHYFYWCTQVQAELLDYRNNCEAALWSNLLLLDLNYSTTKIADPNYQEWFDLATIVQNTTGPIENQTLALQNWLFENRDHPARINPPQEVTQLISSELSLPQSIALVLPLSGRLQPAGEAVLDGFLSALYKTKLDGYETPSVEVFDSGQVPVELIAELVSNDEFDLIIGPLDSSNVNNFLNAVSREQSVLSLNRLADSSNRSLQHRGYSLALESEAIQAAQSAAQRNHKSALLLVEDNSLGQRAAGTFSDTWINEDRYIQDLVRLDDATTLTKSLEQSFHIDQSEQRKSQLQTLLGKSLEFTPRRRQDIDTIFLSSDPVLARQIAPTLDFVFAHDIPLIATSRIYQQETASEENRDISSVEFLSPPWLVSDGQPLAQGLTSRALDLQKLEAMGVDAFYLGRRFQELENLHFVYRGKTGNIYLSTNGNLDRTMEWVRLNGNTLEATKEN